MCEQRQSKGSDATEIIMGTLSEERNSPHPLTVRGVSKRYKGKGAWDLVALANVSLSVPKGRTIAVVGESGSGKSTLLNVAMRLVEPDEGRIIYDGIDVTELKHRHLVRHRNVVQYVPQDPFASLNPRRSVYRSIAQGLIVQNRGRVTDLETRIGDLLEEVGLDRKVMHRFPHELSGGERQRICIARALAPSPKVLVADEPTAALDLTLRNSILDLMLRLQNTTGISIVVATHDFGVVERIASTVAVMHLGRIVEVGERDDILRHPGHIYTRKLIAAVLTGDPNRPLSIQLQDKEVETALVPRGSVLIEPVYEEIASGSDHFVLREGSGEGTLSKAV